MAGMSSVPVELATQPAKLSSPVVVQLPELPLRHQAAPSLPGNSVSKSIDPESSMAMSRLGCTAAARYNGVSGKPSGADEAVENVTIAAIVMLQPALRS